MEHDGTAQDLQPFRCLTKCKHCARPLSISSKHWSGTRCQRKQLAAIGSRLPSATAGGDESPPAVAAVGGQLVATDRQWPPMNCYDCRLPKMRANGGPYWPIPPMWAGQAAAAHGSHRLQMDTDAPRRHSRCGRLHPVADIGC